MFLQRKFNKIYKRLNFNFKEGDVHSKSKKLSIKWKASHWSNY
ncbi:hypothetical protein FLJC2902T_01230 [Flavobacterium limnosediminis JC2902]|uniref:Uncharacterized protein n=1 Tax=Flavobacterium limnosediminis JC2902 TaxID=1341181 RepID=V6SSQ2_9FLAO|nr:hypothetical protein FLJC2902T_01230 [Flavobacterium limnosediminis JC2902]